MKLAIIGAGPVGIYFTKLCLDKGFEVTLIDAGNRNDESALLNRKQYIFHTKSALPNGVHKIGGGSTKWRGRISEFLEQDFIKKDFSDEIRWPISKADLSKYYLDLYETLGAGQISDQDIVSNLFDHEEKFLPSDFYLRSFRYCDKNYFIKLFDEIKDHKNFTLFDNFFCQDIKPADNLSLKINLISTSGASIIKEYERVIIACGTLQTTALLQRSKNILPKSSRDLIGKNLMEHLEGYIGTIVVKSKFEKVFFQKICNNSANRVLDKFHGIGLAISLKDYFLKYSNQLNVQFEIRVHMPDQSKFIKVLTRYTKIKNGIGKLFSLLILIVRVKLFLFRKLNYFLDNIRGVKKFSVYVKSEELRNIDSTLEILENLPNVLAYNHQVNDRTFSLLQEEIRKFQLIFNSHFSSKFIYYPRLNNITNFKDHFGPNWHPIGTTPFGLDATNAVCDSDLQIFGVKNLFVLSASVFPTGSNSNPTFTVLALASRLANSKHFQFDFKPKSTKGY